tara:strand:- start:30 stop:737 length:708 start_codon:yes stop_codon:yes gene_type:complete
MQLVYAQDFWDAGAVNEFWITDPDHWKVEVRPPLEAGAPSPTGPASWLSVYHRTDRVPFAYRPRVRSPHRMAIVKNLVVRDFVMEVQVQSTGRPYPGRDLILIFGFQDAERFAYVQLATLPDERTHNVFVVDHADARRVGAVEFAGMPWTDGTWHTLRLERRTSDGLVRVTLDDFEEPLFELTDFTFSEGHVGIGTYDDTGMFAGLKVHAPSNLGGGVTSDPFVVPRTVPGTIHR